ncbi:protein PFC0760c-like isoform X2 [Diprion similis]|uniref:protein PFC0760c-like isoform X2 n=1 Tax=Diprion similis TaxID=362088 RepID=UPI001EF8D635|nr:protein PFC0760c-like isoform X2 [Diprion similis]
MRFFLVFGLVVFISQCSCNPIGVRPAGLSWQNASSWASALTIRVRKNTDDNGYIEECAPVQSWQEEPGVISVIAFLDASWQYSHRQATMLKTLQGLLEKTGIKGIRFYVVNSSEPEATVSAIEVEDEKEAWGAADLAEDKHFLKIERTREALKNKIDPNIEFIQDTSELKIWEKLSASRDQVLVIDKCRRLSYRVIVPWSILHFPYVKAAILSTYKEQPCGSCNISQTESEADIATETIMTTIESEKTSTEQPLESLPENLNIDHMREIAVKKYNLDATDNTATKKYHAKESQDIPESVIKLLNGSANIQKGINIADLLPTTVANLDDSHAISYLQTPIPEAENKQHQNTSNITDTPNVDNNTKIVQPDSNLSETLYNDNSDNLELLMPQGMEENSTDRYSEEDEIDYLDNEHDRRKLGNYEALKLKSGWENKDGEESSEINPYSSNTNESSNSQSNESSSEMKVSSPLEALFENKTANHINRTAQEFGEMNSEEYSQNADYLMPIRIIMHAPHRHAYDETFKTHEYLVLKLGRPEYHGHSPSDEDLFGTNENKPNSENNDDSEEGDKTEPGSEEYENNDNKNHQHHGNHHQHHHKSDQKKDKDDHLDIIYYKDESPGFYGEDAEYWKDPENVEYDEKLETEQADKKGTQDAVNFDEVSIDSATAKESTFTNPLEEKSEEDTAIDDQIIKDIIEEEAKTNRLIEHYSKLIPWLDYVFD